MRDLPTVRAVRGSVATSAQVKAAPGSGVLAIPVAPGVDGEEIQPRPTTVDAALRYGIDIAEYAERRGFTAAAGTTLSIDLPLVHGAVATQLPWHGLASTVVLVGIGGGTRGELRRAGKAIAKAATGRGSVVTTVASGGTAGSRSTDPNAAEDARALVEGYLDGCYTIPTIAYGDSETRRATTRERRVNALAARVAGRAGRHRRDASVAGERHGELVLLGKYDPAAIAAATGTARATWLARDLANAPANIKNPAWLAEQFATIGAAGGLDVEVWDAERLERQGFGALAAVGAGGEHGPRLAVIRYTPAGPATGHVAVVGKRRPPDRGGCDHTPRTAMEVMKTDMAGAGAAFAATLAVAGAGLPVQVTAVLPLAENAIGAAAMRPDDVLRSYAGHTVEVGNTDAEGRLILADALAYTAQELAPDVIVDIATLTGAARAALGTGMGALFSNRDWLAEAMVDAGGAAGEPVWRLPLASEYRPALDSPIADLQGTGRGADPVHPFVGAGAVTAALFLERFTGGLPWAHLDIAGPARSSGEKRTATGFGAALLVRAVEGLAATRPPVSSS